MKQKIAFLYLNTGGGHVAPARALARELEQNYADGCEVSLVNGFTDDMKISRFFFETGYRLTSNYFEPGYVLFYRATEIPLCIMIGNSIMPVSGLAHLRRVFRENGITKVVCLHEVLIGVARRAIDQIDPSIPLITLVTDPYTAHAIWFHQKNMELVVFSEKLRREAIQKYGFSPDRVYAFSFILSKTYEHPYTPARISEARRTHGIPDGKKVILIAGGGEGLKGAEHIVAEFLRRKRQETLVVVCGKNRLLKFLVNSLVQRSGASNVMVYGFVTFMPDLLNIADCVITKGGASTVMEVLSVGKPVIFSTFIRGQELGNVLFAVHGGAGWYIRKPAAILDKAQQVCENPALAERIGANIAKLGIRNGTSDLARFIYDFPGSRA